MSLFSPQRHVPSHKASEPEAATLLRRHRVTQDGGKSCSVSGDGSAEVGDSQRPTKYTYTHALVPATYTILQNTLTILSTHFKEHLREVTSCSFS